MARIVDYQDWDDGFAEFYDKVGFADNDRIAQQAFYAAFHPDSGFSHSRRDAFFEYLIDYAEDEYGIDFEEEFDWEGFREWYG